MSRHHDLGGTLGFGKVDVDEVEEPFHAEYEGRMWAISRAVRHPKWTIDWWRHVRELIDKDDYLERPYFDSWAQTHMAALIDAGSFELAELLNVQHSERSTEIKIDGVDENRKFYKSFEMPADDKAMFIVGSEVQTKACNPDGHTRLPNYASLKVGWIEAYRGAHIFPDESAVGSERGGHLYTVGFRSDVLWPGEGKNNDVVFLDLWQEYLEHV